MQFCDQISARTSRVVRLPFRAEWLYAYRLGLAAESGKIDPSWEPVAPATWPAMEATGGRGRPLPVGSGLPNSLGIYDMEGNVREWCCDAIVERLTSSGPSDAGRGSEIVYRCVEGGSWSVTSWNLAMRPVPLSPERGAIDRGFRVVLVDRDDFRDRARVDAPVLSEMTPRISAFLHLATPFLLTPEAPTKTVHGMTVSLIQLDSKTKQATVSVLFAGEGKTLTAREGHYFGDNQALFLERVESDTVKLVRHSSSYEYEAKK